MYSQIDHRIYGGCMGGDNRDVTSHYFHASKLAAERSLLIGDKSLRTDSHRNRLVGDPRCEKNRIFTDVKASATDLPLKYIDGRGTKEFGNKQIYRAVVNVLGLPDLLYHTILHDYDRSFQKLGRSCGYIYMEKWKPCFGFRNIMRKVWKILLPGY